MQKAMLAAAFFLGLASVVPAYADDQPVVSDKSGEVLALKTGGAKGDYYRYFAPPIKSILAKAWVDVDIQESDGTPASMKYLLDHQTSYALLQGNVYGELMSAPGSAFDDHLKIVLKSGIGNEVLIAVVSPKMYERSKGSWPLIAAHAKMVRFITASELSGPGRTFRQLMAIDPKNLGKAAPVFAKNMDDALKAVVEGEADVAFMVQFPNPDNPRFQYIAENGLKVLPVLSASLKQIEIPGVGRAFTLCDGAKVLPDVAITTACTPILLATGASNDNDDLEKVFAQVTESDFTPKDSGFAVFWKSLKVKSAAAWDSTVAQAETLAAKAGVSW